MKSDAIHMIFTEKYGEMAVTQNSVDQLVFDEYDNIIDIFPAGLVLRWMRNNDLQVETIKGRFLKDFNSKEELRDFIETTNF